MTLAVDVYQREAPIARSEWGDERLAVIVNRLMVTKADMEPPTPAEVELFAMRCKATGLDPFANQIYAIYRRDRNAPLGRSLTFQTGIDGLWLIAERTGAMDGQDPPEWRNAAGEWVDAWDDDAPPRAARVTVYRQGAARGFVGLANYREYVQSYDGRPQGLWASAPANQLRKCAEAQALRKAFANDMRNVYADEEMQRLDAAVPDDVKADRAAEGETRLGNMRIGDDAAAELTELARRAKLTRGMVRRILVDVAGVESLEHVKRRDLAAVMSAISARIPKESAPPTGGAPNVGTPEVIGPDETPDDGERVEPEATEPVATDGEPDHEAGTADARGNAPPDPAQPKPRRPRQPKGGHAAAAATPPPLEPLDDEPPGFGTTPQGAMYGPGAP